MLAPKFLVGGQERLLGHVLRALERRQRVLGGYEGDAVIVWVLPLAGHLE